MASQSWLCVACGREDATAFCICNSGGMLMCQPCLSSHFTKNLGRAHSAYSIMAYQFRDVPGYFERLDQRTETIPKACTELRNNISAIDRCIEELNSMGQAVIKSLSDYLLIETEKLQVLKTKLQCDVEEAISEVERTIYEDMPLLLGRLSVDLRTSKTDFSMMKLFEYSVKVNENIPTSVLDFSYALKDAETSILPMILGNSLRIHNIQSGKTTASTLSTSMNKKAFYCLINSDSVLCLGGKPRTASVSQITISTGKVRPISAMISARYMPGVLKHGSFVYVFGGNKPSITACEKFSVTNEAWAQLPDMINPRWAFTPCKQGKEIYLPDISGKHRLLEAFYIDSEVFKSFPIAFPTSLSGFSVSYIFDDEITLITSKKQIAKLKLNSETIFREVELSSMKKENSALTNIPPVMVGREVMWVRLKDAGLVRFNVDTLKLTDI